MSKPEFYSKLIKYAAISNSKSIIQLINTIIPYFTIFAFMSWLVVNDYPYWIVLLLAIIEAGYMARLFIIFHDCTHNTFFRSKTTCRIFGHISGVITFTAFYDWKHAHMIHHASSSNLDRRGTGDMWTMTLKEYEASSKIKKLWYHLFRNPFFLFIIAPAFKFLILNRIPNTYKWNKELVSQLITTGVIILIIIAAGMTIGLKNYFLVQVPIIWIGGSAGLWLFYIQHQFKGAYWSRNNEWDPFKAALDGASFYKLPGLLRWFTGNIGYHHIHHLLPNIPNYNLRKCYNEVIEVQKSMPITLRTGFNSFSLKLYDEDSKQLVSFRSARNRIRNH